MKGSKAIYLVSSSAIKTTCIFILREYSNNKCLIAFGSFRSIYEFTFTKLDNSKINIREFHGRESVIFPCKKDRWYKTEI